MRSLTIFLALVGLAATATTAFGQPEFSKQYTCDMQGCSITCITKSKGTLQIDGARTITMTIYPSGTTMYEAELGMGEQETIVTGDSGVCKISHRQ